MKKVTVFVLIIGLSLTCAFAAFDNSQKYTQDKAYRPDFTTRFNKLAYRIWDNPAELAGGKLIVDFPEIAISMNNVAAVMNDSDAQKVLTFDTIKSLIMGVVKGDDIGDTVKNQLSTPLMNYFNYLSQGKSNATNEILKVDAGFGSEIGGFAFRTDVGLDLNSYVESGKSSLASVKIVPEVNAAVSLGFGFKIIDKDSITVKAGASVHPSLRAFSDSLGASSFVGLIEDLDVKKLLTDRQFIVGWAVPFDVSASVGFLKDTVKVYAKANNILGTYHYLNKSYDELMGITSDLGNLLKSKDTFDAGDFELDLGACAEFNIIGIHPAAYLELSDMYGYVKDVWTNEDQPLSLTELYSHIDFGAEVTLFKILQLGFGYSDGFRQIAAGVGFNDIRVQAMYGSHKYNNNEADTLTVVVKLGWDANK